MAYLIFHNRRNTRVELILKDGAPFPKDEKKTEWFVHQQCERVSVALAAEIEHHGFVLRQPPAVHIR
jgi:hypothetical protein